MPGVYRAREKASWESAPGFARTGRAGRRGRHLPREAAAGFSAVRLPAGQQLACSFRQEQDRAEERASGCGQVWRMPLALASDRFGRDVKVHHDARIHRNEVDFTHVVVQADQRLVDQSALVGGEHLQGSLGGLGLLLVPGDQDFAAQGGEDLHGRDARAGRDARRGLHRQAGDARHFQHTLQVVVIPQHGVAAVDMPASEQVHLPAAVDDLPVGEVGALGAVGGLALRVTVERQRQACNPGALEQVGEHPGVSGGGQQQVGIQAREQGAQVNEQRPLGLQRQAQGALLPGVQQQVGGRAPASIRPRFRLHAQDAQGRLERVQLPGRVQHLQFLDRILRIDSGSAARQGEGAEAGGVAQRQGNIGVEICQVGESLGNSVEQKRLRRNRIYLQRLYLQQAAGRTAPCARSGRARPVRFLAAIRRTGAAPSGGQEGRRRRM